MDYLKIYNNLINDAIKNPKHDAYKELHHIKPLCLGGNNDKNNLVKLTARQHFLAHWLLYKIYKTPSLAHAWNCMTRIGKGQEERRKNSRLFKYCKELKSRILSENSRGEKNNFYGKTHSEETRKKISEKVKKNWRPRSPENQLKWLNEVAKKPKTEDHKRKIGEASKGYYIFQNINTLETIRIKKEEITNLDLNIWVHPKKLNPEKYFKCDYCHMVTTKSNLSRWHNDNCKHRK